MALDKLIETSGGREFTVDFYKKDGSLRTLRGRYGVQGNGGKSTLDPLKYVTVYDDDAKGFRAVTRSAIVAVVFK